MTYWYRPEQQYSPPSFAGYDDDGDERAARRTMWLLAAGVAVLAIGAVVFFTVRSLRESDTASSAGTPTVTTPEDAAKVVGGIGPPPGTDVVAYVESRQAALATANGDRVAVVSLPKYATEAKARALVGPNDVVALLAAAPGGQPAVVTGDLAGWVQNQTADARAERDEIQRLIPTVDDATFRNFYRAEVERLNKLISSVKPDGELAFAVVVKGPATALQQLATKGDVRLVDVGPSAQPSPNSQYRGLRPEETAKANDPNTRPA